MNTPSCKFGENNDTTTHPPQRGFGEKKTIVPTHGQTHHGSRHSDNSCRAGILAAVELGGGTSFHVSVFDVLAGPWRHTADGISISHRHVRGRPRSHAPS